MAAKSDINNTNVIFAGLIGTLIVVLLVLALSVLFFHKINQEAAQDTQDVQSQELASLLEAQRAVLAGDAADDPQHKRHLPIARAMQLVVAELSSASPAKSQAMGPAPSREKNHEK